MPQYQDLRARTKKLALSALSLFRSLPKSPDSQILGKQFVRSATSVAANYRAVQRARSKAEFIAKLGTVLEEADETQFWLELMAESRTVLPDRLTPLRCEVDELVAIFVASLKTAKR